MTIKLTSSGPSRIPSPIPVDAFDTYRVRTPAQSRRTVQCETFGCGAWANGWITIADEATPLGQAQAHYIRTQSGRRFTEGWLNAYMDFQAGAGPAGVATAFQFPAGQTCFVEHEVTDGPVNLMVCRGDWRANLSRQVLRVHTRTMDWVEDCAEAVDRFNTQRKRG